MARGRAGTACGSTAATPAVTAYQAARVSENTCRTSATVSSRSADPAGPSTRADAVHQAPHRRRRDQLRREGYEPRQQSLEARLGRSPAASGRRPPAPPPARRGLTRSRQRRRHRQGHRTKATRFIGGDERGPRHTVGDQRQRTPEVRARPAARVRRRRGRRAGAPPRLYAVTDAASRNAASVGRPQPHGDVQPAEVALAEDLPQRAPAQRHDAAPRHGSPAARERAAVPVLDQGTADRDAAGEHETAVLGLLAHLGAGEPAGVLDLAPVDVDVARLGPRRGSRASARPAAARAGCRSR